MITNCKEAAWIERIDPLWHLSVWEARMIFNQSRSGNFARLQYLYNEIEKAYDTLMMCVERRASSLACLGWRAVPLRGADLNLSREQCEVIEKAAWGISNLSEAIEHLELAFFRGFSFVAPVTGVDGFSPKKFDLLKSWNFARSGDGEWWWNPRAVSATPGESAGMERITESDSVVGVERPRPADYPALAIYIRAAIGERDWGRFVERFGVPPCVIVLPPVVNPADVDKYAHAADELSEGRRLALPNGSSVNFASEARGTDPFSAFVQHQEEKIIRMTTGGTLASLAVSGAGTLAGNAQQEVWEQIVQRDALMIGDALMRSVFTPILKRLFPGQRIAARFELGHDAQLSPAEVFEMSAKAVAGGHRIARADLEEETGYHLEDIDQGENGTGFGGFGPRALQNGGFPLQNSRRINSGPLHSPGETSAGAILGAFARDLGPAAERGKKFLDGGMDRAEAAERAAELGGMLPEHPEFADVAERAMAEAFAGHGEAVVDNASKSPHRHCPRCGKFMAAEDAGHCSHCGYTEDPDRQITRGREAVSRAVSGKRRSVYGAMYKDGLGSIDFELGWLGKGKGMEHGSGLLKIEQKHRKELDRLPEVIAKGKVYPAPREKPRARAEDWICVVYGSTAVYLERVGKKRWTVRSVYTDAKKVEKIISGGEKE